MRSDPAFLFYPGDVSEDTQFLNRLERGAYFDLLKAQKRFGKFSLEQLKKILGDDFNTVWPTLSLCLTHVDDMYFIGWVDDSITKRKDYSESRRNNKKGGKKADIKNISETIEKDMRNICESHDEHMGNGNGNENVIKGKEGAGEKGPIINPGASVLIIPELLRIWKDFPENKNYIVQQENDFPALRGIAEMLAEADGLKNITEITSIDRIKNLFKTVVAYTVSHQHYRTYQLNQIHKYFNAITSALRNHLNDVKKNVAGPVNVKKSIIETNLNTLQGAHEILRRKYAAQDKSH